MGYHKCDTSINIDDGNQLKIFHKISQQNACKARNQGPTAISHFGHCTHTSESAKYSTWEITCHVP